MFLQSLERCQLKDVVAGKPEKLDASGIPLSLSLSLSLKIQFFSIRTVLVCHGSFKQSVNPPHNFGISYHTGALKLGFCLIDVVILKIPTERFVQQRMVQEGQFCPYSVQYATLVNILHQ